MSAFHIAGVGENGGTTSEFDLHIAGPGAVVGSLTMSGLSVDIIAVNGIAYIKGHAFLEQVAGAQAAQVFGDNWVKLPQSSASDITQGFAGLTDTKALGGCLATGLNGDHLTESTATVNGQSVVVLQTPAITLDVASRGPSYLVQIKTSGTTSTFDNCLNGALAGSPGNPQGSYPAGTLNFDSWGGAVTITPPPHAMDSSGAPAG